MHRSIPYIYYAIQLIFGPIGKRLPRSVRASVSKGGGGEEKTAIPNWLHLQISAISSSPPASSSMLWPKLSLYGAGEDRIAYL